MVDSVTVAVGTGTIAAQYLLAPTGLYGNGVVPYKQYLVNAVAAAASDVVASQLLGASGLARAFEAGAVYGIFTDIASATVGTDVRLDSLLINGGIVALIDFAAQQIF
jgi:hypothetical protein